MQPRQTCSIFYDYVWFLIQYQHKIMLNKSFTWMAFSLREKCSDSYYQGDGGQDIKTILSYLLGLEKPNLPHYWVANQISTLGLPFLCVVFISIYKRERKIVLKSFCSKSHWFWKILPMLFWKNSSFKFFFYNENVLGTTYFWRFHSFDLLT